MDWQIRKRSDSRSSGNSGWLLFAFVLLIVLISAALTVIPDLLWLAMRR